MLNGEKIVVVMPAYNAARTLRQTYEEMMAHGIVDHVIVVDDASHDDTVAIARTLDRVQVEVHPVNLGYGANQKTCYRLALAAGADIYHHDSSGPSIHANSSRRWLCWLRAAFIHVCLRREFSAAGRCGAKCRGGNTSRVLAQAIAIGCASGEVTCPARYLPAASSINFRRSVRYELGCLFTPLRFRFARWGLARPIAYRTSDANLQR